MKKLILFSAMMFVFVLSQAQLAAKVHTSAKVNQGSYVSFNMSLTDTVKSTDTLSYVFPITHTNRVTPIMNIKGKIVAADTIVDIKYWGSMDGITYYQVYAGSSPAVWVDVLGVGSLGYEFNGYSDICYFGMRYFKIMFICREKTGSKKIPYGYVKFDMN